MIYAYLTDGLDYEAKEKFNRALEAPGEASLSKAEREREAVAAAMRFMK